MQFKFAGTTLLLYTGGRPELSKFPMHAFMVGVSYYYGNKLSRLTIMFCFNVSIYSCPCTYIVDFNYTHMCFVFILFSIFRACLDHCFVLWCHTIIFFI